MAAAQVIVRGCASFRTDHVGKAGDSDLEFRAEASFGLRGEGQAYGLAAGREL